MTNLYAYSSFIEQILAKVLSKNEIILLKKTNEVTNVELVECKQLVVMMSVPSATVFARRAFSYLMNDQAELALRDAMQAQVCIPDWPTAFYLQALALSKLGMETDAQDMLNDGAAFESKRSNSWRA